MIFLYIIIILVCLLLVGVILVQNSKGGGLASNFASSNQVMGVRKTADFLEKATWGLCTALMVLCLAASAFTSSAGEGREESAIKDKVEETAPIVPPSASPGVQPAEGAE